MKSRIHIVPEAVFAEAQSILRDRLERAARQVDAGNFASLLDGLMVHLIGETFQEARADEGTVWLVDDAGQSLVPAYNSGPNADQLVGRFTQPLAEGLISMVFASEQPFLENHVQTNARQSKRLDALLGNQTCALMAVPLYFVNACRGVISLVQLKPAPGGIEPEGFASSQLGAVERMAAILSRLLDLRLLSGTVGWACD